MHGIQQGDIGDGRAEGLIGMPMSRTHHRPLGIDISIRDVAHLGKLLISTHRYKLSETLSE